MRKIRCERQEQRKERTTYDLNTLTSPPVMNCHHHSTERLPARTWVPSHPFGVIKSSRVDAGLSRARVIAFACLPLPLFDGQYCSF
jgi:hypothetical protein